MSENRKYDGKYSQIKVKVMHDGVARLQRRGDYAIATRVKGNSNQEAVSELGDAVADGKMLVNSSQKVAGLPCGKLPANPTTWDVVAHGFRATARQKPAAARSADYRVGMVGTLEVPTPQ